MNISGRSLLMPEVGEEVVKNRGRIALVIQPSASHYREPFIRELLDRSSLSIVLFGRYDSHAGATDSGLPVQASEEILDKIHRIEEKKVLGGLSWDRKLSFKLLRTHADLFVLEGNVYNLTTWLLTCLLRLRGRKVAFWGHGWKRPEFGVKLAIRKLFYKLPNAHFVYGDWAKSYAQRVGLSSAKFFPIYNSFASGKRMRELELQRRCGTQSRGLNLIFSGRLTQRHGVDSVVTAVLELRSQYQVDIRLIVVGSGPEYHALAEAVKHDIDAVEFCGPMYSLKALQQVYGRADYAVSPGASGLNVVQALSFSVPVIAATGHPDSGPELEAIRHGETGLVFPVGNIQKLKDLLMTVSAEVSEAKRIALGRRGYELVKRRYTAEQHASAFEYAACQVILRGGL